MYKIRDWLYISGYPTASSKSKRDAAGITAVLTLHKPISDKDLTSEFLYVRDSGFLAPETIEKGAMYIKARHAIGDHLLVSCGAGISRSVTFGIIALVEIEGLTMVDAYEAIYTQHPRAMPDQRHWQAVADYYDETNDFWQIWGDLTLKGLK